MPFLNEKRGPPEMLATARRLFVARAVATHLQHRGRAVRAVAAARRLDVDEERAHGERRERGHGVDAEIGRLARDAELQVVAHGHVRPRDDVTALCAVEQRARHHRVAPLVGGLAVRARELRLDDGAGRVVPHDADTGDGGQGLADDGDRHGGRRGCRVRVRSGPAAVGNGGKSGIESARIDVDRRAAAGLRVLACHDGSQQEHGRTERESEVTHGASIARPRAILKPPIRATLFPLSAFRFPPSPPSSRAPPPRSHPLLTSARACPGRSSISTTPRARIFI